MSADQPTAMQRMGYQTASQRPHCGNCQSSIVTYINPDSWDERERFCCGKGHFAAAKNAVCNEWEAAK